MTASAGDCEPPALAVVIPVYNEGVSAQRCAVAVAEQLSTLSVRAGLLIVDDGSTDGTAAALREVSVPPVVHFELLCHPENRGYGAALRTGAQRADELGFTWVLFMDSDLTNPPEHLSRFVSRIDEDVDYLKASRYGAGASVEDVPLARRLASRAGNLYARALSGTRHRDPTNGFRAIRTSAFLELPVRERGFPIIMEELYWAERHGLRGEDVPTTLRSRSESQRRSLFGYKPSTILRYAQYPVRTAGRRLRSRVTRSDSGSRT